VAEPEARQRVDKWLWFARFFKTRGLASEMIGGGRLRLNSAKTRKPAHPVGPGDVLTFPQGDRIRVIRVLAVAARRGPAAEAQGLYQDLEPAKDGPGAEAPGEQPSAAPGPG
jgi:ribosome-associated heat shock protein Hsp15